jgi:hypothetical protein
MAFWLPVAKTSINGLVSANDGLVSANDIPVSADDGLVSAASGLPRRYHFALDTPSLSQGFDLDRLPARYSAREIRLTALRGINAPSLFVGLVAALRTVPVGARLTKPQQSAIVWQQVRYTPG